MSTLSDFLVRDINRDIEGVVKADDRKRIHQEIDEYVITGEVRKMLTLLFDGLSEAIQRRKEKSSEPYPFNGSWIFGYFGSGKSHLLKILGYLLADDADPALRDAFLQKTDDEILRSQVKKVFSTPAASILFNIDQQADAESDDQENIILLVFEKVLNRAVGYCDEDPIIADFERDLDDRGEYGAFRGVDPSEAESVLERYEIHRSLTAEKFAKRVKAWLDRRSAPDHRIYFLADEVGQFVANKRDRMLNLQTVAETLATVCDNRAWVFVTSQEDLDSVIGDADQTQRNDFSRITARFHFRLALTSSNVEEVIQKRLLEKTPEGDRSLREYFNREHDHLKNLFHFGGGVKDIGMKGEDHFSRSYPFLPYQYHYLQQALRGLSAHNAFMGRHVSRGERSMLEIFQDVGRQLAGEPVIRFASFDRMFDGIRNTLKSGILTQINLAEGQLSDPMALRVLKSLLLLKYVEDFTATAEHLTVLMVEDPAGDRGELRNRVQAALDLLEYQSYIERIGDVYQYLTDQEKDIEVEIKNTSPEHTDIRRYIAQVIYDKILKQNRILYDANQQEYTFSLFVDDELYKQAKTDLSIRIVTHLNANADDETALLAQAMARRELMIELDTDRRHDEDLRLFHQTRTFLNHNTGAGDATRERIINEKRLQNQQRERRLREEVIPALAEKAALYVADRKVDISIRDPRQRIIAAFQDLVSVSYPNLRMLQERYTEERLKKILFPDDTEALFAGDAVTIGEDESEVQAYLLRLQKDAKHSSIATVKEAFSGGQYGWYEWAILCVLAKLYRRDVIELVEGSRILDTGDVFTRLSKAHGHDQVTVRIAEPIDSTQVATLSRFFHEFFHHSGSAAGGKALVIELKEGLLKVRAEILSAAKEKTHFPFLSVLSDVAERYEKLATLEYRALATEIIDSEEELLQEKLETVDAALSFMNGPNRDSYERIQMFLQGSSENFLELGLNRELDGLHEYLRNPRPWASNATKKAIDTYESATGVIVEAVEREKAAAREEIEKQIQALASHDAYAALTDEQKREVTLPLEKSLADRAAQTRSIPSLLHLRRYKIPTTA